MNLLVASPWGLPDAYGGPAVLVDRLFATIASDGTSVDLIYAGRPTSRVPMWAGQATLLLDTTSGFGKGRQLRWMLRVGIRLIENRRRYNAVHFQGAYLTTLVPMAVAFILGMRTIIMPVVEDGDLRRAVKHGPAAIFRRCILSRADAALALSPGIRAELQSCGVSPHRIHDIDNLVDVRRFYPSRREDSRLMVIGTVGMIGFRKGAHLLAEAILSSEHSTIMRGLFVGPVESDAFASLIRHIDVGETIRMTGFVPDAAELMRQMDVFVLPSESEGMPGALVEAMASGLPCVVTDVGAMGVAVREAKCGFVVTRNVDQIRWALDTLCRDNKLRLHFATRGRVHAEAHYSDEFVAERYRSMLESL